MGPRAARRPATLSKLFGRTRDRAFPSCYRMGGALLLFFLDLHGFKVLGVENLPAVQTLHIFHAVSSGNYLVRL